MDSILVFFKRSLYPHAQSDVVLFALAMLVFLLHLAWKKRKNSTRWIQAGHVLGAFIIPGVYWLFVCYAIPFFQRFPDDKFGVIIPTFSGATLANHYGEEGLNRAIVAEVTKGLQQVGMDSFVNMKAVSWTVGSKSQALALMKRYNANAVLWGSIVELDKTAKLTVTLEAGEIVLDNPFKVWNIPGPSFQYDMNQGPNFTLNLSDTLYNLQFFARQVAARTMSCAAVKEWIEHPAICSQLIVMLPTVWPHIKQEPLAGFLALICGDTFESAGNIQRALFYWRTAYDLFSTLYYQVQQDPNATCCEVFLFVPSVVYDHYIS